jgi:hypothetical protein
LIRQHAGYSLLNGTTGVDGYALKIASTVGRDAASADESIGRVGAAGTADEAVERVVGVGAGGAGVFGGEQVPVVAVAAGGGGGVAGGGDATGAQSPPPALLRLARRSDHGRFELNDERRRVRS